METVSRYRHAITRVLSDLAEASAQDAVEVASLFDTAHDNYLLIDMGWHRAQSLESIPLALARAMRARSLQASETGGYAGTGVELAASEEETGQSFIVARRLLRFPIFPCSLPIQHGPCRSAATQREQLAPVMGERGYRGGKPGLHA